MNRIDDGACQALMPRPGVNMPGEDQGKMIMRLVMMFAAPVLVAAGLPGEVTPTDVLLHLRDPVCRDRIATAEHAISQVLPHWISTAGCALTAMCPGWAIRHVGNSRGESELWRARRINGSGYWAADSQRAFAVTAPSALCVFARVEQQAVMDIEENYPDLLVVPGWSAFPPGGELEDRISAGTAAALAARINEAVDGETFTQGDGLDSASRLKFQRGMSMDGPVSVRELLVDKGGDHVPSRAGMARKSGGRW